MLESFEFSPYVREKGLKVKEEPCASAKSQWRSANEKFW